MASPAASADDLLQVILQECERLDYARRMRYLVTVGERSKKDEQWRLAIERLHKGSLYEQLLALQTCYGSGDAEAPFKALRSPSKHLKGRALRLAVICCTDEQILETIPMLPTDAQAKILRLLRARKRQSVVDMFLEQREYTLNDDRTLRRCVTLGSNGYLEGYLSRFASNIDWKQWKRLARSHPETVLDPFFSQVEHHLGDGNKLDDRMKRDAWMRSLREAIPSLTHVKSNQHTVIDLLRIAVKLDKHHSLKGINAITKRYTAQVAELLGDYPGNNWMHFGIKRSLLAQFEVFELAMREIKAHSDVYSGICACSITMFAWPTLTVARRIEMYKRAGHLGKLGSPPPHIIVGLPREIQIDLAREHFVGLSKDDASFNPEWIALLPWDEAMQLQEQFMHARETNARAYAIGKQVEAAQRDPQYYQQALDLVSMRHNDQDPVKVGALRALVSLHARHWTDQHLPSLTDMIRTFLNATDLSHQGSQLLADLVGKLLPFHPGWAWEQLMLIYRERGHRVRDPAWLQKGGKGVDVEATLAATARLARPVLSAWRDKEEDADVLWLAHTFFGLHLDLFPELQHALVEIYTRTGSLQILTDVEALRRAPHVKQALEDRMHSTTDVSEVTMIFQRLRSEWPGDLTARVPNLLKSDATWIKVPFVQNYIKYRRQDLITPYLTPQAWIGRLNRKKELPVVDVLGAENKLTHQQQHLVADNLRRKLRDPRRTLFKYGVDLEQLSRLHYVDAALLLSYIDDSRPFVQESAIKKLPHLDAGHGFPKLIDCLGDERARIAIYVLEPLLENVPADQAVSLLKSTSLRKVTVAKEVIRLVAARKTDNALGYLLELSEQDLHKDIRIALVGALGTQFLQREECWPIFLAAAESEIHELASAACDLPTNRAPQQLQTLFRELLLRILKRSDKAKTLQIMALRHIHMYAISDPEHVLLPCIQKALESSQLRMEGSRALFAQYIDEESIILSFIESVLSHKPVLDHVITHYQDRIIARTEHAERLPFTQRILSLLEKNRFTQTQRFRLIFEVMPVDERLQSLCHLAPRLHADALVKACSMMQERSVESRDDHLRLAYALSKEEYEDIRRLGVAALRSAGQHLYGSETEKFWTDEKRDLLKRFQDDASTLVAEAAMDLQPPERATKP